MNDQQIADILTKENEEFKKLAAEHRLLDLQAAGYSMSPMRPERPLSKSFRTRAAS